MDSTSVPLFIDDRAGSRDLMRLEPVRSTGELCRLDSGDAMVIGNGPDGAILVGVEVKSVWDLVGSADTGRLQATQIPAMLRTYGVSWLLWFGQYRVSSSGKVELRRGKLWKPLRVGSRDVPYGYIEGVLFDLAVLGIHTRHVFDVAEAAVWLGSLHRWWGKPWDKHRGMRTLDRSRDISLMPGMPTRPP